MSTYDDYHRAYYQAHKAKIMQYNAELRALRKRLHLCRECGRQDAYTLAGRTKCADCVERDTARCREKRGYNPAWMRQKKDRPEVNRPRGGNGICWQCNKRTKLDGKKLCQICYEKKVNLVASINPNNDKHPWRNASNAEVRRARHDKRYPGNGYDLLEHPGSPDGADMVHPVRR